MGKKLTWSFDQKRFHQVSGVMSIYFLAPSGIGKTRLRFSFFCGFGSIHLFRISLNNLLVLGQQNRFVLVEVDIDNTIGVVIKNVIGGRLAVSVGDGTIAIAMAFVIDLGIGALGGGGKAVVEAFRSANLGVRSIFAQAVPAAEQQHERDGQKDYQHRHRDNDNVGTDSVLCIRRRRGGGRLHLGISAIALGWLVVVIDNFAAGSQPSGGARAVVKVAVAVLLGSDALASVQTLHHVASGTGLKGDLAFPALVVVRALAKGTVLGRVVRVGNIVGRGEAARGSVLAVECVATGLAVVAAPSERTEALGGLGFHARLLGGLGVMVADAQAAVLAVFVVVTGAVVVLDGADDTDFAILAGSVLGALALVFLRGFVKDDAFSAVQTLQLVASNSRQWTGRKRNLAFDALVVSGALAIKGRVATPVVVGNVLVVPAAGAVLAVQVANVFALAPVAGGKLGTRAVVALRHVGLVGRQDTDPAVHAFHPAAGASVGLVTATAAGGFLGRRSGVFSTAHVSKEAVDAQAVIEGNFVVQVLQDASGSIVTLVSVFGAHLLLGRCTRSIRSGIDRLGSVAPIAVVVGRADAVVLPVLGGYDTKATVLALSTVFRADGFVGGEGYVGGGGRAAEYLVAPITGGVVGTVAEVVAGIRKDDAIAAVLADIGRLRTNDYVVVGHGE